LEIENSGFVMGLTAHERLSLKKTTHNNQFQSQITNAKLSPQSVAPDITAFLEHIV